MCRRPANQVPLFERPRVEREARNQGDDELFGVYLHWPTMDAPSSNPPSSWNYVCVHRDEVRWPTVFASSSATGSSSSSSPVHCYRQAVCTSVGDGDTVWPDYDNDDVELDEATAAGWTTVYLMINHRRTHTHNGSRCICLNEQWKMRIPVEPWCFSRLRITCDGIAAVAANSNYLLSIPLVIVAFAGRKRTR